MLSQVLFRGWFTRAYRGLQRFVSTDVDTRFRLYTDGFSSYEEDGREHAMFQGRANILFRMRNSTVEQDTSPFYGEENIP